MVSTNQVYDGFIVKAIRVERVNEIVWKFLDGNVLIMVVLRVCVLMVLVLCLLVDSLLFTWSRELINVLLC